MVMTTRRRQRANAIADRADVLDLDEAEALGELVELSPFWSGDARE
jgi:hypothetical protein